MSRLELKHTDTPTPTCGRRLEAADVVRTQVVQDLHSASGYDVLKEVARPLSPQKLALAPQVWRGAYVGKHGGGGIGAGRASSSQVGRHVM